MFYCKRVHNQFNKKYPSKKKKRSYISFFFIRRRIQSQLKKIEKQIKRIKNLRDKVGFSNYNSFKNQFFSSISIFLFNSILSKMLNGLPSFDLNTVFKINLKWP